MGQRQRDQAKQLMASDKLFHRSLYPPIETELGKTQSEKSITSVFPIRQVVVIRQNNCRILTTLPKDSGTQRKFTRFWTKTNFLPSAFPFPSF